VKPQVIRGLFLPGYLLVGNLSVVVVPLFTSVVGIVVGRVGGGFPEGLCFVENATPLGGFPAQMFVVDHALLPVVTNV
jgi:hypothetical protein